MSEIVATYEAVAKANSCQELWMNLEGMKVSDDLVIRNGRLDTVVSSVCDRYEIRGNMIIGPVDRYIMQKAIYGK